MINGISMLEVRSVVCGLLLGNLQFCVATVEVETLPDSVVPMSEQLQMYAQVIARVQLWAKGRAIKQDLQGIRIPNVQIDLHVQQWLQAIDSARERVASRFANVPRILLYGPPGTGKSYTCKQIVEQSRHVNPDVEYIKIDCSSLVTRWQNSGASAIKDCRERVLESCEKGRQVIVLLEEIHEIASINKQHGESAQDAQSSAAVELDLFMDACEHKGVLFIATTNYLHDLAPALCSRFNQQIKFDYCDECTCKQLIKYKLLHNYAKPILAKEAIQVKKALAEASCDEAVVAATCWVPTAQHENALVSCVKDVFGSRYAEFVDEQEKRLCHIDDFVAQLDTQIYDAKRMRDIELLVGDIEQSCAIRTRGVQRDEASIESEVLQFYCSSIEAYLADVTRYLKQYAFVFKQENDIQLLAHETAGKDLRFLNAIVQELVADAQLQHGGAMSHDFVVQKIAAVKKRFADEPTKWNAHEREEADDINRKLNLLNTMISVEGRNGNSTSVDKIKTEFGYEGLKVRSRELFQKNNA